jgi:hypothetical protein
VGAQSVRRPVGTHGARLSRLAVFGRRDRAVRAPVLSVERGGARGGRRLQRRRRRRRAVGGGFYDRPDAPAPGTVPTSFSQDDFLNGLFDASDFPKPAPGANGTLGRNTFRGPRYFALDLSVSRSFAAGGTRQVQVRLDAYNALNTVNLFLPNADLSVSNFGKSTQAFDPRTLQLGVKFLF